jgi:hypothetical protein
MAQEASSQLRAADTHLERPRLSAVALGARLRLRDLLPNRSEGRPRVAAGLLRPKTITTLDFDGNPLLPPGTLLVLGSVRVTTRLEATCFGGEGTFMAKAQK